MPPTVPKIPAKIAGAFECDPLLESAAFESPAGGTVLAVLAVPRGGAPAGGRGRDVGFAMILLMSLESFALCCAAATGEGGG